MGIITSNKYQLKQGALQMHRDHTTCHKYEISHLTRLAIGERDLKGYSSSL